MRSGKELEVESTGNCEGGSNDVAGTGGFRRMPQYSEEHGGGGKRGFVWKEQTGLWGGQGCGGGEVRKKHWWWGPLLENCKRKFTKEKY